MTNTQNTSPSSDPTNKQKFEEERKVLVKIRNRLFKIYEHVFPWTPKDGVKKIVIVMVANPENGWSDVCVEKNYDDAVAGAELYVKALELAEAKPANFDHEKAYKEAVISFLHEKLDSAFLERVIKRSIFSALHSREGMTSSGDVLKNAVIKAIKDGTAAAMSEAKPR